MKRAFSLVELMIVVAILGILAAIVLPEFQSHSQKAKEAAAKENLHILRVAIELYAAKHNGVPPGYSDNDPSGEPADLYCIAQLVHSENYLRKIPVSPFNGEGSIKMISNHENFPSEPILTELYAWVYQPATKTIKLNWSGTDSAGIAYFDY